MTPPNSNSDGNSTADSDKKSPKSRAAADRKERLAAQLRYNLKKRKDLARARKSTNEDST